MPRTRKQIIEQRRQLRNEYGELFDSIAALLFRADPVGIAFDNENLDEYEPEAGTILPRLKACACVDDVLRIVYEEFVRWFDADNAGPQENYEKIASDIWRLWQEQKTPAPGSTG